MTLRALQDCLIIEPYVEKHAFLTLVGEKAETGVVVSVGPLCEDVSVGDHVYFGVGQEFSHDKNYVVMRERHLIGVLNG